jgi:hypothetical protein
VEEVVRLRFIENKLNFEIHESFVKSFKFRIIIIAYNEKGRKK